MRPLIKIGLLLAIATVLTCIAVVVPEDMGNAVFASPIPTVLPLEGDWEGGQNSLGVSFEVVSDSQWVVHGVLALPCGSRAFTDVLGEIAVSSFTLWHPDRASFIIGTFRSESFGTGNCRAVVSETCYTDEAVLFYATGYTPTSIYLPAVLK